MAIFILGKFIDSTPPPCNAVAMSNPAFTLPDATEDSACSSSFTLIGTAPFNLTVNQKPTWMTISLVGNTVSFTGTPDNGDIDTGVQIDIDIDNCSAANPLNFNDTIDVDAIPCTAVTINATPLPDATENVLYNVSRALSGTSPFTLGATTKPAWMTISIVGSNLVFNGTPGNGDIDTGVVIQATVTNCSASGSDDVNETIDVNAAPTGRNNLIFEDKFDTTPPYTPNWSVSQLCCAYSATSVTSPTRIAGGKSVRFEQKKSDWTDHAYARSELQHPLEEGAVERWYGGSVYFPSVGFEEDDIQIIWQWHHTSGSGSPPLSLNTEDDNYVVVWSDNQVDENYDTVAGITIQYDQWIDIVWHIIWAADGTGLTEIYFNGVLRYTRSGANMFSGFDNYMKIGNYKFSYKNPTPSVTTTRVFYFDEVRIGDENATYYDVAPGDY